VDKQNVTILQIKFWALKVLKEINEISNAKYKFGFTPGFCKALHNITTIQNMQHNKTGMIFKFCYYLGG